MPVEDTFGSLLAGGDARSGDKTEVAPSASGPHVSSSKTGQLTRGIFFRLLNFLWNAITADFEKAVHHFIPESFAHDPETGRQARLICGFGYLGSFFGVIYALFYVAIGHRWGALVVVSCSTGFGLIPWLMKRTGSLHFAGNMLSLILVLGFSTLCLLEGGMQGHAIAWLASVPLCSMLLMGRAAAGRWMLISFAACSGIAALGFMGVQMKPAYDPKWESIVSAAGYMGFILFMFTLGVIFETSRKRAFSKMQEALAKLETSNTELTHLNQEKNEFMGIAAHDLRNPLTVVIGTAQLLRTSQDQVLTERLISNIINAGTRMLHLVKNFLDTNAIEQGHFAFKLEACDMSELIRECLQNHALAAERKEIQLVFQPAGKCHARVDRNATLQILENLVSNALKYSPKKTAVSLKAEMISDRCIVTVSDQGPGVSEEDLKKMFGKFTRLSARPTGGESSNGLGLSIVKRLTEAMNGNVRCESKLGCGASFVLELQAANRAPTPVDCR